MFWTFLSLCESNSIESGQGWLRKEQQVYEGNSLYLAKRGSDEIIFSNLMYDVIYCVLWALPNGSRIVVFAEPMRENYLFQQCDIYFHFLYS